MSIKRYLVTSALPYANGPQHVGHLTGAYLPADVYVRYLRLTGADVRFVCGSDEYGAALAIQAQREGTTPREVVDKNHLILRNCFEQIGISFDIYHRTSSDLHRETAQIFFKKLYEQGVFVEKTSEQYYDEQFGQFLADRFIIGTCPRCAFDHAYGDQCERCGSSLSPDELLAPRSALSNTSPSKRNTRHWYLPMGKYQQWVGEWIAQTQQKESWKDHVLGQCSSWLKDGLGDRSMTRDLDWGVPVPLDTPDAAGKVLYVWLDAPIGYISATKALAKREGFDWELYWKDEETKLVHFIGKDNIVFHCIIFPILLHAHGGYILPTNVPANQFMNLEGDKMSTSRNYAVWLPDFLSNFAGMEDVLRYVLIANMPENKDSSFSWRDFQARNNNELVAIFGNFVNRALVLLHKYYEGKLPTMEPHTLKAIDAPLAQLKTDLANSRTELDKAIHDYRFRDGLACLMNMARAGNKFLTETEPWKVAQTQPTQAGAILSVCAQVMAVLAVFSEPFLPFTAKKMQNLVQLPEEKMRELIGINPENLLDLPIFEAEHIFAPTELLFRKIDDAEIQPYIDHIDAMKAARQEAMKAEEAAKPVVHAPPKPEIQYDDFAKLDIRTATIVAAERVPKADKLLKLQVDLGFEQRTVVSGIAQHFSPEAIIGQRVLLLANLAPRKMRGVESQGMILMAEQNGQLVFVAPNDAIDNGMGVA